MAKPLPSLKELTKNPGPAAGTTSTGGLPSLQPGSLPSIRDITKTPGPASKPKTKKKKGGGGILGAIGRVFTQGGKDLYNVAVNTPAGIAAIGAAEWDDLKHGRILNPTNPSSFADWWEDSKVADMVRDQSGAIADTFKHPLRNPGYTLLNALPVAGSVAKVGLVGKAAKAGQITTPGQAAKALLTRTPPTARTLRTGGLEVHPESSRSALGQVTQKAADAALQKAAARKPGGRAEATLQRKVGKAVTAQARTAESIYKAGPAALQRLGRKLSPAEQKALQLVAEEAPIEQRITTASARVTGAKAGKERARHQAELDLLHQAKPLVVERGGRIELADPKLRAAYQRMEKVAGDRETLLKELGKLTEESVLSRKTDAGRVSLGATYEKPTPGKLGQETPALARARARVASLQTLHDRALSKEGASTSTVATRNAGLRAMGFTDEEIARGVKFVQDHSEWLKTDKASAERALGNQVRRGKPGEAAQYPGRISRQAAFSHELLKSVSPIPSTSARADRIGGALSVAKERLSTIEAQAAARVKPTGIIGAEDFTASPDALRIPDAPAAPRGLKGAFVRGLGTQGTIGKLRDPGTVTHPYTGALREHALRRQDTTQLVAESGLEAGKYAALRHVHDLVRQAATATPQRADDIAVRLDNLKSHQRLPAEVRKFLDDPDGYLTRSTPHEAASMVEKVRERLFINPAHLEGDAAAEFARLNAQGKIGWVPKRVLGDLGKPQAPLSAVTGGRAVGVVDAINNASRLAILYLKPAYAIPNLLGNAALNILQQGWAAPGNLARAARVSAKLGPEYAAKIDALMGEGFATSVSAHGQGLLHPVVDKAARVWSKGVDVPFRRASFLYEARRSGHQTPNQLRTLLDGDAHGPLNEITLRANREIIDYANLSPVEREVIRRAIFFYPWIKGSTTYAGRMVREHPVMASVQSQIGQQGQQYSENALGPLPSTLQGLIPVGGNMTANPSSAAILQTPAVVAGALAGLLTGNTTRATQLANFYTPALSLALAEAQRRDPDTGYAYPGGTSPARIAWDTLGSSLPQAALARNLDTALSGGNPRKLYPPSIRSSLLQFLIGGIAPRETNRQVLNQMAAREKQRQRTGR